MVIAHSKPTIGPDDIKAVSEVVASGQITQGKLVEKFEKSLADYVGTRGGVALNSGTAALHLALLSLGIKEKDEVILPTYVCIAPFLAVRYTGATVKLCDINSTDFNISLKDVKRLITKKTKAIIVPHMFGMPADIESLLKTGLPVIEDCAHSIGATYRGKRVGGFGTVSIFSFYATKMLACGEGGMVCSNSLSILKKIRNLREYDEKNQMANYFNYKMSDLQAALGLSQLSRLAFFIKRRRELAHEFNESFSECGNIELPVQDKERNSVFYRYIIKNAKANMAIRELKEIGVICRRPVYKPLHRYFKKRGFPVSENVYKTALSIPLYPSLKKEEVQLIKKSIRKYFSHVY